MLNLSAYLDRIGYYGPAKPTAEVLRHIHRSHLFTAPFENLDIALGHKIICDENAFIQKIVERRRGGFCYELNGAFAALLRALGFQVTLLSACVARDDGTYSPEFDHLALGVDLDEPWLADVGFGDLFLEPLRLQPGLVQEQDRQKFRIVKEGNVLILERSGLEEKWKREYSFTLTPHSLEDFAAMCHYHQTSPESSFTRKSVCTIATVSGRVTLADQKLIFTRDGIKEEKPLLSEAERHAALKEYFGIVLARS
jgi:N-hydroxyarylamine O-acetyltransferase